MGSVTTSPDEFGSMNRIEQQLELPRGTVPFWVREGRIAGYRLRRRTIYVRRSDVLAEVEASRVEPATEQEAPARQSSAS